MVIQEVISKVGTLLKAFWLLDSNNNNRYPLETCNCYQLFNNFMQQTVLFNLFFLSATIKINKNRTHLKLLNMLKARNAHAKRFIPNYIKSILL